MKVDEREDQNNDAHLVSLLKKGDISAFESLVERHQKKMLNIAYRMTGNYEDACEIIQDAFFSAYKNIGAFEERSRFSTWLYSIVINHARNFIKKSASQSGRIVLSLNETAHSEDCAPLPEPASKEPSALEKLEQREVSDRLRKCIMALDAEFREVIVLRDIQGFSYEEIGSLLGIAAGTVKSRIFRARESVKDCLKNFFGRL